MRVNRELALVPKGDWKASEAIVDDMLKANVAPSQRTLSLLIQQYRERNQPKRAELMLEQLAGRTTQGTASSHVLTSLADCWCNASNMKRAEEIVAGMEADGPQPSVAAYTVINDGMMRNQDKRCSQELIQRSQTVADKLLRLHRHRALLAQMDAGLGDIDSDACMLRLETAFKKVAGDAGISDLQGALNAMELLNVQESALLKRYLKDADENGDGTVDYGEFIHAVKAVRHRLTDTIFKAENEREDSGTQAKEEAVRLALKHPITARLAQKRAGWIQSFFWRFDSIRNAFSY
jgi:hypothetical protein